MSFFKAVESMRQGQPPAESARIAVQRIVERYKDFEGAVVAVNKDGVFGERFPIYPISNYNSKIAGAACYGLKNPFPFTIASKGVGKAVTMTVDCIKEFSEATPQDDFH